MVGNKSQDELARAATLHRQGRLTEAIRAYRELITRNPRNAAALNLLGLACFANGELPAAVTAMRQALALMPDLPAGHFNLGLMFRAIGQQEQAAAAFRHAVAAKPDDVGARVNLGIALNALERPAEAAEHFALALEREPNNVEAHHNLGVALQALNRSAEAIPHYQRAIALMPDLPNAAMNLGNALHELGRDAEALPHFRRALALRPDYAEAHMNLARSLQSLDSDADAARHFDRAIALKPDWALAKFNKGMFCLALRQFSEGWELYEQRWAAVVANRPRLYRQPRWDGERVDTLLVWAEQGLGDQILHAGLIPELAGRAGRIVFEVEPRLRDAVRALVCARRGDRSWRTPLRRTDRCADRLDEPRAAATARHDRIPGPQARLPYGGWRARLGAARALASRPAPRGGAILAQPQPALGTLQERAACRLREPAQAARLPLRRPAIRRHRRRTRRDRANMAGSCRADRGDRQHGAISTGLPR